MRYIFITGISTGIGRYLSDLLIEQGFYVIGSIRSGTSIDEMPFKHPNFHTIEMDLMDETTIESGFRQLKVILKDQALFALINNAGIAVPGPITHIPISKIKDQFQVNVFGLIRLIQLVFPLLKSSEIPARIINMSSVSGLFASPFLGAYAGSKFALEAISDSLRRELRFLNIKVILIEPGSFKTKIWQKNLSVANDYQNTPFGHLLSTAHLKIQQIEKNGFELEKLKSPVLEALNSKNPKARYLIYKNKILLVLLSKFLPVKWADYLVHKNLTSNINKIRPI